MIEPCAWVSKQTNGEMLSHIVLPSKERSGVMCSREVVLRDVLYKIHMIELLNSASVFCAVQSTTIRNMSLQ